MQGLYKIILHTYLPKCIYRFNDLVGVGSGEIWGDGERQFFGSDTLGEGEGHGIPIAVALLLVRRYGVMDDGLNTMLS